MKKTSTNKHKELIKSGLVIGLTALILFFFCPVVVHETSMEPNFHDGDRLIASRAYGFSESPEYGDIVIFKTDVPNQNGKGKTFIKRVIAVPGDTIEIRDGYVYVNDELLDEPYLKEQGMSGEMDPTTVPDNCYFCCGDNREVSNDSRNPFIGFIPKDRITGKVVFKMYPFDEIGKI